MTRQEALEIAAKIEAAGNWMVGTKVGVIREDAEAISKGGIIIPEDAQRKPLRGRIVLIGRGVITRSEDIPATSESKFDRSCIGLNLGDFCTFTKYGGVLHELPLQDGTFVQVEVMHAVDIFVVGV